MRETAEVLRNALDLIRDESNHCRGVLATNDKGSARTPTDGDAVRFCARGALWRVTNADFFRMERADAALHRAALALFGEERLLRHHCLCNSLHVSVNNDMPHSCTVAVFEAAIAAEECENAA